jgi:hypothetical protein
MSALEKYVLNAINGSFPFAISSPTSSSKTVSPENIKLTDSEEEDLVMKKNKEKRKRTFNNFIW